MYIMPPRRVLYLYLSSTYNISRDCETRAGLIDDRHGMCGKPCRRGGRRRRREGVEGNVYYVYLHEKA